jgi:hypothetical protein
MLPLRATVLEGSGATTELLFRRFPWAVEAIVPLTHAVHVTGAEFTSQGCETQLKCNDILKYSGREY